MQCWQLEKNCARCWRKGAKLGAIMRSIFGQEKGALEVWQIYHLRGLNKPMM